MEQQLVTVEGNVSADDILAAIKKTGARSLFFVMSADTNRGFESVCVRVVVYYVFLSGS